MIVLLGARRTGKTVLLNQIIEQIQEPFLLLNGENMTMAELLANRSPQSYRQLLGDKKVLLLDEAQKIDQIGNEVSYQELGKQLGMSKNTVEKYLGLLSKVFVIHKVGGFSKNLRKEIVKNVRWYFYDNGIRNTIIANLNPLRMRNDVGTLWENYIFGERIKFQHYNRMLVNNFFWRTYDQQEIDWVEEREGKLFGYEFKWNPKKKVSAPSGWRNAYPDASFEIITPENYFNWVN